MNYSLLIIFFCNFNIDSNFEKEASRHSSVIHWAKNCFDKNMCGCVRSCYSQYWNYMAKSNPGISLNATNFESERPRRKLCQFSIIVACGAGRMEGINGLLPSKCTNKYIIILQIMFK